MLLMMPAAYHRLAEEGEDTERFYRLANRVVLSATVPLALALGAEFAIVCLRVGLDWAWAALLGAVTAILVLRDLIMAGRGNGNHCPSPLAPGAAACRAAQR